MRPKPLKATCTGSPKSARMKAAEFNEKHRHSVDSLSVFEYEAAIERDLAALLVALQIARVHYQSYAANERVNWSCGPAEPA